MPPVPGVNVLIVLSNVKQEYTVASTGTYHLVFEGEETGDLTEASTAAAIETALEALSNIGTDEVVVTGTAPGPYTVEFGGGTGTKFLGQDPTLLVFKVISGTPSATPAKQTPADIDYFAVGGQRGVTLNRGIDTVDASDKDNAGWPVELATKRTWSIDFDNLVLETDNGRIAIENAYLNMQPVGVRITTPGGNKYSGSATVSSYNDEGPHDGLYSASGTLSGFTALTKT